MRRFLLLSRSDRLRAASPPLGNSTVLVSDPAIRGSDRISVGSPVIGAAQALQIDFPAILDGLRLAVFVFRGNRLLYHNQTATSLVTRLREQYHVDLLVMLRDHLPRAGEPMESRPAVILLTAARGEPFYLHVLPIGPGNDPGDVAISVRELGIEREAFARRYRLSRREAEVAELVLRGYGNPEIATALGIARTTTKRHLTRIFQKIGVDSRTRLVSRLA